ncbi:MAG: MarR family winged helix-turn-helix transcriptional regulator, partial [Schleiferiaceae bacterium]|nr:MarR family winged helix-turn-helix transcriptional regulator [Schleiferiaceae bacterium]
FKLVYFANYLENQQMMESYEVPIGKLFGQLTKRYIGIITKQLDGLDAERYFYAIYVIGKSDKCLTQNDLSEHLHVDKATIVRIVDYLSARDYIYRDQNPADRRQYFLRLTHKGEQELPKIAAAFAAADAHCLSALHGDEQQTFLENLHKVVAQLSSVDADAVKLNFTRIRS